MKPSYRELFPQYSTRFKAESHFMHLVAPSVARPGEPFSLRAVMMDATGMPDEAYAGSIPLQSSGPGLHVPATLEFAPENRGSAKAEGLVADHEGGFWVQATPEGTPGAPPVSNPIWVAERGPRLFWGDIHVHTLLSNCHPDTCKGPEFAYWYARNVSLLDFAAPADHLRGIHSEDGRWETLRAQAQLNNLPGAFVSLLGFESSHARGYGGDNNIYYRDTNGGYFWLDRDDMRGTGPRVPLTTLWDWLDNQGVPYISIPHHTGRAGKYRDFEDPFFNPDRETVLEVFSWWGSSEARHDDIYLKGGKADCRAYWRDALALGYRYGVIGSSDTHHTMPGTPYPTNAENYHYAQNRLNTQGLAGIYADELHRDDLFDALLRRECFATTFWRPVILLNVSGIPMGKMGQADRTCRRHRDIQATVVTAQGGRYQLYRNNEPVAEGRLTPPVSDIRFSDQEPAEQVCIRDAAKHPEPFIVYDLKIESQGSSQFAWSSPVWIDL